WAAISSTDAAASLAIAATSSSRPSSPRLIWISGSGAIQTGEWAFAQPAGRRLAPPRLASIARGLAGGAAVVVGAVEGAEAARGAAPGIVAGGTQRLPDAG